MPRSIRRAATVLLAAAVLLPVAALIAAAPASATTAGDIATKALSQVGQGPCGGNNGYYATGTAQTNSCDGNGGAAHSWCADFAGWVWQQAGITDLSTDLTFNGNHSLDDGASSFYNYGQRHGTLSMTPAVGDAVVYNYGTQGNPPNWASHVAIVVQVNSDGTVDTVGGNTTAQGIVSTDNNEPATGQVAWGDVISGYIAPVYPSNSHTFYHDIRAVNGSWQGWQPVAGYNGAATFAGSGVAIAGMPDGSSQMLGIGVDGNVYHDIRAANGSWQGWQLVAGYNGAASFAGSGVAITGMPDGSSQMLAIGVDGNVYHNIRAANGSWQGWQPVAGYNGAARFAGPKVAIAGMPDGSSQMLAIGVDGNVYHNIRAANGTWQGWQPVAGYNGAVPFTGSSVAITGMPDGSSQMLAIGTDRNVYHNVRGATGVWQGWQPVAGYGGNARFAGSGVAIGGMPDGSSQMLAIGTDGNVYHNIRAATGLWQGWQPLPGYNGAARFAGNRVAIAGMPDGSSQLLATN